MLKDKINKGATLILLLLLTVVLLTVPAYKMNIKINLDAKATELRARTYFIVQQSTYGQWKVVTTTFSSDTEKCPVSVTVLPGKTNIVLTISADGNLWRSTDYGKSFAKIANIGYSNLACEDGEMPECKVGCNAHNSVYLFAKDSNSTVIGLSNDYGKTWKFKKLNFSISSAFMLDNDQYTVYFTFPKKTFFENRQSYLSEGFGGFNFKDGTFAKVSNFYPQNFWESDEIYPARLYGNDLYFSFSNDAGCIYRVNFKYNNGKIAFHKAFENPVIQAFSKVKSFCKISDGQIIVGTNFGIFFADIEKNKMTNMDNVLLTDNKILKIDRNVIIKPCKIEYDAKHNIVFMSAESGGLFAGIKYRGQYYWIWIPPLMNGNYYSKTRLADKNTLMVKNLFLLKSSSLDSPFVHIYDFAISYDPFYVYLATNYGLVRLEFKNLH